MAFQLNNDFILNFIQSVLQSGDGKHFCLTYLNMEEILFDIRKMKPATYKWMLPTCFTGHVIGMFFNEITNKSHIVGRIHDNSPQFEDQVYVLNTQNGAPAQFSSLVSP